MGPCRTYVNNNSIFNTSTTQATQPQQIHHSTPSNSLNPFQVDYDKIYRPYITSDNKAVYRHYYGNVEDLLNWNRVRFYTVLDVKNSPFREVLLNLMKSN